MISDRSRSQTLRSQDILQKELFLSDRQSLAIADFGFSDRRFRVLRSLSDSIQTLTNNWYTWLCQSVLNQPPLTKDTRSRDQSFCDHDRDRNFDRVLQRIIGEKRTPNICRKIRWNISMRQLRFFDAFFGLFLFCQLPPPPPTNCFLPSNSGKSCNNLFYSRDTLFFCCF